MVFLFFYLRYSRITIKKISSKHICFELFVYVIQVLILLYIDLLEHVLYNKLNANIWDAYNRPELQNYI